ncbi:phage tail protein [Streptomyces sp. NPDC092307]|uniref:phage tail protein n=1 Tax=Streptomyces sp. NPDC092307 TaxID=3366013 RepID=UPI0037FC2431
MTTNTVGSAFRADTFTIQIDGAKLELLKSVSGLSIQVEVITSESITEDGKRVLVKTPGKPTSPSVTIVRGFDKNPVLTDWITKCQGDKIAEAKKNVTVALTDSARGETRTATLTGVWVSRWSVSDVSASSSSEVDETVVLECDDIQFK